MDERREEKSKYREKGEAPVRRSRAAYSGVKFALIRLSTVSDIFVKAERIGSSSRLLQLTSTKYDYVLLSRT